MKFINFFFVFSQLAVSFHDGSYLPEERLRYDRMEIRPVVQFRSAASRNLDIREAKSVPEHPGIWEFTIDLGTELASATGGGPPGTADKRRIKDLVNEITAIRLTANYKDGYGDQAIAEMLAMTQYSIGDKHIKVLTSTRDPKVINWAHNISFGLN